MLGNFIYSNPTKLYFGDEAQKNLVEALSGFGKKVMLTYGGGSIKRNGVYDDVIAVLNPRYTFSLPHRQMVAGIFGS